MKKTKEIQINHYFSLALIIIAGFSLFALFRFNQQAQAFVVLLTAIFYVGWGIIHHQKTHILTRDIILEYILIATIGVLVLLQLISY